MGAAGAMARGVKRERDDSTPGAHALEAAGEPDEDCDPINGLRKRKKPQLVTGFLQRIMIFVENSIGHLIYSFLDFAEKNSFTF